MNTIKNIFKHKIFFTQLKGEKREYREFGIIEWSSTYESNTIYKHKNICFTDKDELFTQIKPFLYYLGSKDLDREGEEYQCKTFLLLELRWNYKSDTILVASVETDGNFIDPLPCGEFDYIELKKPFEIRVNVFKEYSLLESLDKDDFKPVPVVPVRKSFNFNKCVVCLSEKPEIIFITCLHCCVCLKCEEMSPFIRCPTCRTYIYMKVKI